ncbi:MAG: NADH-quinone oxidoreductase subunit J [Deltaproteobacteria bacterium]|jgi:NADH-quinone oxidoreductase subunit J|nr:NADH-quinone oxidoreductase subunit J [Deltaproteobacteria bacterium]
MQGPDLSVVAFLLLSALTLGGGGGVIFSGNIVYSALSLMVSFLGVAGLYVMLEADFVAGVQVLVYVGGVLVLTLFAVMLTHRIEDIKVSNRGVGKLPGLAAALAMFAGLIAALEVAPWKLPAEGVAREAFPSTQSIGNALLGRYVLPFEVASIVLLSVLVGAVVLSRKEVAEPRVSDDA